MTTTPTTALRERLHDRRFAVASNPHGVSGADTVFHYRVEGSAIVATYAGGRVASGHVLGRATGADSFETVDHGLTHDGALMAGWSRGRGGVDDDGRTTLDFEWGWLHGAEGGGHSRYVELRAAAADGA